MARSSIMIITRMALMAISTATRRRRPCSIARLIGHLESIKHMIEDGRDCSEVLVQLSAVDSAIKGVSRIILKDHLEHCIVDAVRDNDQQALEQLNRAIDRFIK